MCKIKYMICDDSQYHRQYIRGENTDVEKDPCKHQEYVVQGIREYNPSVIMQREDDYNMKKNSDSPQN